MRPRSEARRARNGSGLSLRRARSRRRRLRPLAIGLYGSTDIGWIGDMRVPGGLGGWSRGYQNRVGSGGLLALITTGLVAVITGCSPIEGQGPTPAYHDDATAVAGTILRVTDGRDVGELRITEMTAPDAGDPPYPPCLIGHTAAQRVINFDLNWAGINFGSQGTAPAVRLTITGPGGTPMTAEIPQGSPPNNCATVRSLFLSSEPKGWQLVYAMALRVPAHARLRKLTVSMDGHLITVRLSPVCNKADCFQQDPPVPWSPGNAVLSELDDLAVPTVCDRQLHWHASCEPLSSQPA
jgi:hypothetical protein